MKRTVHVLATCRRPELADMTLLVFRTLRVGFPTSDIVVWIRGNDIARPKVEREAAAIGARVLFTTFPTHDGWVAERLMTSTGLGAIVDTDVVFHRNIEPYLYRTALTGELEPSHWNPVTRANHVERLHTAVLAFNGPTLREACYGVTSRLPMTPTRPPWDAVGQRWMYRRDGVPEFWDTAAGLWQAGIGDAMDEAVPMFTHLHCGTWSDVASCGVPDLRDLHRAAAANDLDWAEVRRTQAQWYKDHPPR